MRTLRRDPFRSAVDAATIEVGLVGQHAMDGFVQHAGIRPGQTTNVHEEGFDTPKNERASAVS